MTQEPTNPPAGPAGGDDLEYDLAHEVPDPGEGAEAPCAPEPATVSTVTADTGGDYGYDLAHDVPRATPPR